MTKNIIFVREREESSGTPAAWLARLTVADGLYGLLLLAAAVLRLVNLGRIPLSPQEAESALAAWSLWQPESIRAVIGSGLIHSPAHFSLTTLITQVLGDSDAAMRLAPALFGLGVVALPWFLRHHLGPMGALVTGLLLAISPLQTIAARTAGGEAIALFAGLLLLVAWVRLQDEIADFGLRISEEQSALPTAQHVIRNTQSSAWLYTIFAALALGLLSAPLFYSALLTLALAWAIQSALGPPLFSLADLNTIERPRWRAAAAFGGGLFVVLCLPLLWQTGGLGAAASLPATWLGQFSLSGALPALLNPFLAIGRYEPLLFGLGLIAIVWVIWREEPLASFCVYWLAGLFLLMLLQHGAMANTLLALLPGYLLLGVFTDRILGRRLDAAVWVIGGSVALFGMLIFINVARYLRIMIHNPQQLDNLWIAFFVIAFGITLIYFVATWQAAAAYRGTLLGLLVLFVYYSWGTSWWLNHYAANDPRERWVTRATDDEVRLLATNLVQISRQVTGADFELDVAGVVDSPVLRWYLRGFRRLQISHTLPPGAQNQVILTPIQAEPAPGSDYLGSDYGLIRDGVRPVEVLNRTPMLDTLRWWLFHESILPINDERVILWLRADLVGE